MNITHATNHKACSCPNRAKQGSCSCGFTLLELIIVIVIMGILGSMGAEFIAQAFKGFKETNNRIEMYEEGRLVLTRLERELQGALPNAVDVSSDNTELSFGVIDESAMAGVSGQYEEEHPTGGSTITDRTAALQGTNPLVSIYNTSWADFKDGSRIYKVTSASGVNPMTLSENIGPASPYGRFYAVRRKAVRFVVREGRIFRETAPVDHGGAGSFADPFPLVDNVVPSDENVVYFSYEPGTSTRSSLVVVHFAIERNGEKKANFHKEIKIRNVP